MKQVSQESTILTTAVIWTSVVVCVTVAMASAIWFYGHHITHRLPLANNVFAHPGLYYLPDQSTVLLKSNSQLTYNYTTDRHDITLTGEAYFQVNDDPQRPFYVHTEKMLTTVLDMP